MRFAVCLLLGSLALGCGSKSKAVSVPYGAAPAFALTKQDGAAFKSDALKGKPWVASFIFTRCPSTCPLLTSNMVKLQRSLISYSDQVNLVSISVDPEHDTPEVLTEYATRFGADLDNWSFLTGDRDHIEKAVVNGFRLALGERVQKDDNVYDIVHSQHFVLVDKSGQIRGYYPADGPGRKRLVADLTKLLG